MHSVAHLSQNIKLFFQQFITSPECCLYATTKLVFIYLCNLPHDNCHPRQQTIAKALNVDVRTIKRATRELRGLGLISVVRNYRGRGWVRINSYLINYTALIAYVYAFAQKRRRVSEEAEIYKNEVYKWMKETFLQERHGVDHESDDFQQMSLEMSPSIIEEEKINNKKELIPNFFKNLSSFPSLPIIRENSIQKDSTQGNLFSPDIGDNPQNQSSFEIPEKKMCDKRAQSCKMVQICSEKSLTHFPVEFNASDDAIEFCIKNNINIKEQIEKFKKYHIDHKTRYWDWGKAFLGWLANALSMYGDKIKQKVKQIAGKVTRWVRGGNMNQDKPHCMTNKPFFKAGMDTAPPIPKKPIEHDPLFQYVLDAIRTAADDHIYKKWTHEFYNMTLGKLTFDEYAQQKSDGAEEVFF